MVAWKNIPIVRLPLIRLAIYRLGPKNTFGRKSINRTNMGCPTQRRLLEAQRNKAIPLLGLKNHLLVILFYLYFYFFLVNCYR